MSPIIASTTSTTSERVQVIAIDLDDVLARTNQAVADWYNELHGTRMVLDDFHYYHYWKNPHWGTPDETHEKVKGFYADRIMSPKPISGALEGLQRLRDLGFRLVIVTARHLTEELSTKKWLEENFPGFFDDVVCTGQFQKDEEGEEEAVKLGKPEVCHKIGAKLIVDDSVENALACASASPPVEVLLFGDYQWNKRESRLDSSKDHLSFDERSKLEGDHEWWKKDVVELPANVTRVTDWQEVVAWVVANLLSAKS